MSDAERTGRRTVNVAPSSEPPMSPGLQAGSQAAGAIASAGGAVALIGGPAGWIVGGTIAAAGGTVALVSAIRNGKVNRAAAVKWARKLGLPKPQAVPGFVVKLAKKDRKWQRKTRDRLKAKLKRLKKQAHKWKKRPWLRRTGQVAAAYVFLPSLIWFRGPRRLKEEIRETTAKIRLIEALWKTKKEIKQRRVEQRERRVEQQRARRAEQAALAQQVAAENEAVAVRGRKILAGGAVLALLLFGLTIGYDYMKRRRRGGS